MRHNRNALICRSIHEESNGEFILVGVIAGGLTISGDFFADEFSLFMTVSDMIAGEYPAEFRIVSPSEKTSTANVILTIPEIGSNVTLQLSGIPFVTSMSGKFRLDWRLANSRKWEKLVEIPVVLQPENSTDKK